MFPALHSIYCCNHQQKNPLDVFCFSCHATMFAEPTSYIVATTSRTTLFLAYGEGDESRGGVCVMLEWWSFFCLINVLARMKACACFFLGVLRECQSQWNFTRYTHPGPPKMKLPAQIVLTMTEIFAFVA
eukprot:GEMP01047328.1.p1 GENE.GEMP01047328.1~~GEMP01047328.1.p1  ORF type:complete len:130 (+),score=6.62 GEMP01047328.1:309-698(+)